MVFIPEKINLLFIEDDERTASAAIQLLKSDKHIKFSVTHRADLKSGLEFLKTECIDLDRCNIDVILLDLMLPNSVGVNTYLKVNEACDFLPIVIISKHEEIACECVKLGAQDFLIKPVSENLLIRSLKYAIERTKIKNELEQSEEHYRNLIEATNAGIYEMDFINDKFTYVNNVMCKLTGWTKEELLSMSPSKMLTENSIKDWIMRLDAMNKGDYIEKTFEYEAKIKDGSTIWILITSQYKEDEKGKVIGARVIAIDITEAKRSREEVKKKEEYIFNELENRIRQWRDELKGQSVSKENKIIDVKLNIQSISNNV